MPNNLKAAVREAENGHFDFALVNLFKDLNFRDEKTTETRCIAQTLSDNVLQSTYWQQYIIAKLSNLYA